MSLENEARIATAKIMLAGLVTAFLMNAYIVSLFFNLDWHWPVHWPVRWMGLTLGYMIIFFHELGHAVMSWFYGYITLPSFDFTHGGGMTYAITGQLWPLNLAVYGLLGWLIVQARGYKAWQCLFVVIGLFHLATAYGDMHRALISFGGPAAESIIGGYMLYRAWLDKAPRGVAERFLNAAFGFGMAGQVCIQGWALLHDPDVRAAYLQQKGGHALGDFDQIAAQTGGNVTLVTWFYLLCGLLALVVPFILYLRRPVFAMDDLVRALDAGQGKI